MSDESSGKQDQRQALGFVEELACRGAWGRASPCTIVELGLVIGANQFAREMFEEHQELRRRGRQLSGELQRAREEAWAQALAEELKHLRHESRELGSSSKSAEWKLRLVAKLKLSTTVTNRWLGEHLHLGARDEVCRKLYLRRRCEGGRV